jgi:hypothetical protein
MSSNLQQISVPARIRQTPRPLTDEEYAVLIRVADTLMPATSTALAPSQVPDYDGWLNRALAARAEHFSLLVEGLGELVGVADTSVWNSLKTMSAEDPERFHVLSSVVAGAYLMAPTVRERIGYPGQGGAAPRLEEAAEQLEDGILNQVIDRGPRFISAAGE